MARLNELTIRAALETAGVTRGVQEIIRELQRFEQAAASALGDAAVPDVAADAQRAAQAAGEAYSEALAQSITSTRQNVVDAAVTSVSVVAEESAAALRATAQQTAEAVRELDEAAGSSTAERQIRDWQDWADAVRESSAAAEAAAAAQRDLASSQEEVARQTEFSADQIARWDAEQRARDEARAADEARRASATAQQRAAAEGAALRQQYEHDIAAIKEAQLRQLLTPEEAAEAARISAEAYNRELLQAIERGRGAGAFQGAEGQRVFTTMAGDLRNVQQESQRAAVGMGRLNMTMASLFRQATGTHPAIGQLANVVGSFAVGSVVMVGVLAGLAALAAALRHFGREAREAREELEEALSTLERIAEQRRVAELGPGGREGELVRVARERRQAVEQELETVQRLIDAAPSIDPREREFEEAERARAASRVAALQEEYRRLSEVIDRGEEQINAERQRAASAAASSEFGAIASLIANNRATQEVTDQALTILRAYRAGVNAILSEPITDEGLVHLTDMLRVVDQLEGAFDSAADARRRLTDEPARALREEVATLTEGAELRTLQARDMGRILELEERFSRELAAGNLTLEERNRLTQMLREVDIYQPAAPALAPVDASVEIAGVTIANPDEMARLYREQVAERIERERIEAGLNLNLVTIDQDTARSRAQSVQAAQEATQQFNETVQASNEMLSAFGDLADTAGALDEGLAQALRGAQTFGEGLARYRLGENLQREGQGVLGALSMMSGVVSAAVGVFNVVSGIMASRGRAEREAEARIRQTTDALDSFRRSLSGWERTPEMTFGFSQAAALVEDEMRYFANVLRLFPGWDLLDSQLRVIEPALERFGLTMQDVERIANDLGMNLFTAAGSIDPAAWEAIRTAMDDAAAAMTGFADNFRGIQRERSIRDSLLGIERDAADNVAFLFGTLEQLAPRLAEQYLAGVDQSDVEAVRAAVVRMFDAFAQEGNVEFAELMRGMLPDDLISWFEQVGGALEDFESQIQNVADELRGVPQGFRILNLELVRYNAMQVRTAEDLARQAEEARRITEPGRRDPVEEREREGGRDRPIINDHRTFTIPVTQHPGESGEEFAQRVVEILRRTDREDEMTGVTGGRYRPAMR